MPHVRSPRPGSRYYIPRNRYRYAVAFCLTYSEMKDQLRDLTGWHAHENDGMPHGTSTSNPTEKEGMKRAELANKIRLIEETVRECSGAFLYQPMLLAVTSDSITYDQLRDRYGLALGRNQYSMLRRQIYWTIEKAL